MQISSLKVNHRFVSHKSIFSIVIIVVVLILSVIMLNRSRLFHTKEYASAACRIMPPCISTKPYCKIPTPKGGWCTTINKLQNGQLVSNTPISHVVVIMMENHSFDNMFGQFPGVNGATLSAASNPLRSDIDHRDAAYQAAYNNGNMDEFPTRGQVQYSSADIPTYWNYASQFALGDNFFSSAPTDSTPNHVMMIASQTGGDDDANPGQGCGSVNNWIVYSKDTSQKHYWSYPCYAIPSLPQLLSSYNMQWKYYDSKRTTVWDAPLLIQSLYGSPSDIHNPNQFVTDVQNGNMATVSWITPNSNASDHPTNPWQPGENYVSGIINSIMNSQYWPNTAIFLSWDDWGGFYDHVQPPLVDGDPMGGRVPLIVISPYTPKGYISHGLSEFSSINKFIEDNWNLPNLGARDANPNITDLMDYFNFIQATQSAFLQPQLPYANVVYVPATSPNKGGRGNAGSLTPTIGDTKTSFTYSAVYLLPNQPSIHTVTIDGTTFSMRNTGKKTNGGVLYQYVTSLPLGHHSYTFTFSGSNGSIVTLPYSSTPFPGPDVYPFSVKMAFSPATTDLAGQPVTYQATYTSPTNIAPIRAELDIDGQAVQMQSSGGTNYKKGVVYSYTTSSLSQGEHYYRTIFDDGSGPAIFEGTEKPIIVNFLLTNSSVFPATGSSQTPFTFQTTYTNPVGTVPVRAEVDVDNIPYALTGISGTPSAGEIFQTTTTLPDGNHTYVFLFNDGTTMWTNPHPQSTFAGPFVGNSISPYAVGTIIEPDHADNPDFPFNFSDADQY